jgi:hypothetical protein
MEAEIEKSVFSLMYLLSTTAIGKGRRIKNIK